jgi:hypothetical protein
MAKSPDDRYPSVQHFGEDLRRWQRREPVQARPVGPLVRAQKWVRRHPLAAGGLAAAVVGAASLAVYWQTRPAWLDVRITPVGQGTNVTLDDKPLAVGSDGRVLISSSPGRHILKASAPHHEPNEREVLLVRGRENAVIAMIELDPRFGFISLTSEPEGATVAIADSAGKVVANGVTPFHSPRLPSGH